MRSVFGAGLLFIRHRASGGAWRKRIRSRDAYASESCKQTARIFASRIKKGGGAPTGASNHGPPPGLLSPSPLRAKDWEGGRQRATQTSVATRMRFGRARLSALHRGACHANQCHGSAQAVFPATCAMAGIVRHALSQSSGAPRGPVVVPAEAMPGPPGSGVTSPARGNRACSINRPSPVDVPWMSRMRLL
jgi:hypothetical protein